MNNLEQKKVNRGLKLSAAEFKRLWQDPTLTTEEIGRRLGIHQTAVCKRATARGFAPRGSMARIAILDTDLFREMWDAGVQIKDMARHFDVSGSNIKRTRQRLGLPNRTRGNSRSFLTLEQFHHDRLARQMARTALQEQVMMLDEGCIAKTTEMRSFLSSRRAAIQ